MRNMNQDIEYVLADRELLTELCEKIGRQITEDYKNSAHPLVFVVVLKGSVFFAADLIRSVNLPCEMEFMKVSSYGAGTESTGSININLDLIRPDLDECDLLIVEDIIDSGNTLSYLVNYLKLKGAKSVRTCTLLDKPSRRTVAFTPDYRGKEIPDEFVIGYGLDYAERYRALPYVGVLSPSVYMK